MKKINFKSVSIELYNSGYKINSFVADELNDVVSIVNISDQCWDIF
jgi:hypothetical protein